MYRQKSKQKYRTRDKHKHEKWTWRTENQNRVQFQFHDHKLVLQKRHNILSKSQTKAQTELSREPQVKNNAKLQT